jgi:membrane protease YdiL (CAAX protease family)
VRRLYLAIEFGLLFVVAPTALAWWRHELMSDGAGDWPGGIVPGLLVITGAAVFVVLLRDRSFDRRRLTRWHGLGGQVRPVVLRFAVLGAVMLGYMWMRHPAWLFSFPRQDPAIWAVVMIAYPLVSVIPQGVIWRAFLMHRYQPLLGAGLVMWLVAAATFSYAHVFFLNVEALVLTFAGGLMFVYTYRRSGSLVPSIMEHALYGCWAFTLGYGRFLYGGTAGFNA